jgi:hypothetical protein
MAGSNIGAARRTAPERRLIKKSPKSKPSISLDL